MSQVTVPPLRALTKISTTAVAPSTTDLSEVVRKIVSKWMQQDPILTYTMS